MQLICNSLLTQLCTSSLWFQYSVTDSIWLNSPQWICWSTLQWEYVCSPDLFTWCGLNEWSKAVDKSCPHYSQLSAPQCLQVNLSCVQSNHWKVKSGLLQRQVSVSFGTWSSRKSAIFPIFLLSLSTGDCKYSLLSEMYLWVSWKSISVFDN